jgi:hypothetical protein
VIISYREVSGNPELNILRKKVGFRENPFWFHENLTGRTLLEPKGFYLEPKRVLQKVLLWVQPNNPFRFYIAPFSI